MQKYKIDPAKTSYYICKIEIATIFVKSKYLGMKESRIFPAQPSGIDIPPPKRPAMNIEGHQRTGRVYPVPKETDKK